MTFNLFFNPLLTKLLDRRGDEYSELAVVLVLLVLGGVAAFSDLGNKIVELITRAAAGL